MINPTKDTNQDLASFKDFVYNKHASAGNKEFPKVEHLQTDRSKKAMPNPEKEDKDDSTSAEAYFSHGTAVASKAVRQKHGVARKATVVSVKYAALYFDFLVALEQIAEDIHAKYRDNRAVIVDAVSQRREEFDDDVKSIWEEATMTGMNRVWIAGVPVAFNSGNYADRPRRQDIDTVPMLYERNDGPFINVCGCYYDVSNTTWAQFGPHVTLHAPDTIVPCQTKNDGTQELHGTSYAAPFVACTNATYMSYDTPPWGSATNLDRAIEIRDYMKQESSWQRKKDSGVNILWDGAKQEDHDSADPDLPSALVIGPSECNGLHSRHYVLRDTLSYIIDADFCPTLESELLKNDFTSADKNLAKTVLEGTPESTMIIAEWSDDVNVKLSVPINAAKFYARYSMIAAGMERQIKMGYCQSTELQSWRNSSRRS
ncbi:hypothetical protein BDV96DRAFT_655774 [Lophiotrema nucula]|uniref:Peptidase S8/S53 domain-containing protein n=1 Tax=Lophiotrema nucula TaxID=690887 RepID=A0A6A5YEF1_9PLEO|nr:hypothetical protein BDV96DRAFT_655774 [Lophiotrema nucula]